MFLSRVRLDLNKLDRESLFKTLAGDAYTAHQLLWTLFNDDSDRQFLFRQEFEKEQPPPGESKQNGLPLFYVLSRREPNIALDWLEAETKPFEPQLAPGDRLGFMLRANPTVARSQAGRRSQRSDVLMDAKYRFPRSERRSADCKQAMEMAALTWLERKGAQAGFELAGETMIGTYRQHRITKTKTGQQAQFSTVDYSGVLEVTEPVNFVDVMARGIGRAKAFGCGLMLIRRLA